ncbi:alpha/beta hydrolase family protein [Gilvimarinus agarilyticus]|uniref:alpha/beta hydrolase family protein n=1 Tax=Gilvimarinus agarilyticus TaxID=679259 RepID=UPI000696C02D|nr:S9 family peptidase [Gilvimarinus agarilyticus]
MHKSVTRPINITRSFARLFVAALLPALFAVPAIAAEPAPSSEAIAQQYGALPVTSMLEISPNGELIAFRKVQDGQDLVVVYSLEQRKVLTGANVNEINPHDLYFINDDYLVLVASERRRMLDYRGEMDVSTAFALNVKSGELEQLLRPGDNIYRGQSGLGAISGISADHRYVYMPAFVGSSEHDQSPERSLMKVDLQSPRRPKVVVKGDRDTLDYFLDGNGNVLAQEIYDNRYDKYVIKVPDGNGWRNIYEESTDIITRTGVGLTPDRQFLIILATNEHTGRVVYYKMSLADGTIADEPYGRDDADIESVIRDINGVVYGLQYSGFTPSYELFEPHKDAIVKEAVASFEGHSVSLSSWSDDWQELVVYVEGPTTAGSYYLVKSGKPAQFLAGARGNIKPDTLAPRVVYNAKARDGMKIPTILTLPLQFAGDPKNMPTIMLPHGGPETYDRLGFDWLAQAFAASGYLVLQPQFRGSSGFGLDHIVAGRGEWGRKMQDDLTDSLAYFAKAGLVDDSRVCIVGGSYGGYAALVGVSMTPGLYRCAVSINGVSDLNEMLDEDRSKAGDDHWVISYFEQSIANGEYTKEDLAAISPVNHAKAVKVPVLLIHGEDDEVVSVDQSDEMYDALKDEGKQVTFLELKNENHYLMQGETRTKALAHVLKFLQQNLSNTTLAGGALPN